MSLASIKAIEEVGHMSDNTYWLITGQADGSFDLSRHNEDTGDEFKSFRRECLSLREATEIADADPAEYGYRITWNGGPICRCGEAQADHFLYIAEIGDADHDHDIVMGPICPGQLENIMVYEEENREPSLVDWTQPEGCLTSDCYLPRFHAGKHENEDRVWI